jgi:hypothetical protein
VKAALRARVPAAFSATGFDDGEWIGAGTHVEDDETGEQGVLLTLHHLHCLHLLLLLLLLLLRLTPPPLPGAAAPLLNPPPAAVPPAFSARRMP